MKLKPKINRVVVSYREGGITISSSFTVTGMAVDVDQAYALARVLFPGKRKLQAGLKTGPVLCSV